MAMTDTVYPSASNDDLPGSDASGQMSPLVERAYHAIRARIISGALPGGHPLAEDELGDSIGVSRTPIREALKRLHGEGLVVLQRSRRARVVEFNEKDYGEIFDVRTVLEAHAAARAATKIGANDLVRLADNLHRMEEMAETWHGDRISEFVELNTQFHLIIIEASENQRLKRMILPVIDLVRHEVPTESPLIAREAAFHHRQIVAALRHGDAEWAESQMRAHLKASYILQPMR